MTRIIAVLASLVVVATLAVFAFLGLQPSQEDQFAQCRSTAIAGGTDQIGGPFTLIDKTGAEVTSEMLITKPTLLYFGYTFCPDVCPLDTARNADATDILDERGIEITPVFISIDPKRDTPEVVGDFAANLHDRMIGLTGSPAQVKAASQAYRTYYKAHDDTDDEFYVVDHSTFSYLVLPKYGFVEFFRRDLTAEQLADKIACFVDNA